MLGVARFSVNKRISRTGALLAGGMTDGAPYQVATIQKFYFSVEAISQISTTLPSAAYSAWGATKVGSAGYKLCGYGYDGTTTYATGGDSKIDYATNTLTNLGSLYGSATKVNHAQGSDNGTKSIAVSGYDLAISGWSGAGKKFIFATDSAASTSASISSGRGGTFSMSNTSNALYVAGGTTTSWYCDTNQTDKISYSTETTSYIYMPGSKTEDQSGSGISNSGVKGYAMAGFDGDCTNGANGVGSSYNVTYANDTYTTSTTHIWGSNYPGTASNQGVGGYVLGGRGATAIQRMAFSNDTISTLSASLATAVGWPIVMADSLGN